MKILFKTVFAASLISFVFSTENADNGKSNESSKASKRLKSDIHINLDTSDIGKKYVLVGKFGEIGEKHIIEGVIDEKFLYPGNTVNILTIDGNKYKGVIFIDFFKIYPLGTKVKFEVREMAEISEIQPLNNPNFDNVGKFGCRLHYEVTSIVSVQTP
jgi:hypothetical protein